MFLTAPSYAGILMRCAPGQGVIHRLHRPVDRRGRLHGVGTVVDAAVSFRNVTSRTATSKVIGCYLGYHSASGPGPR